VKSFIRFSVYFPFACRYDGTCCFTPSTSGYIGPPPMFPIRRQSIVITLMFCFSLAVVAAGQGSDELDGGIDRIGGVGGVYFLAEPGELIVEVERRDLNRSGKNAQLRAILLGPDRRVIQDVTIPDDGEARGSGIGPATRRRLATMVRRKGVYALNITVAQDRYGDEIAWGFRTNCSSYLIETSRGHRDRRHEEPIVLHADDRPGDVCFLPRAGSFDIEINGLKVADPLTVYDADNGPVASLLVDAAGKAQYRFEADPQRGTKPWRLHLPVARATIQIDGVTRWDAADPYPNLCCWTPDRQSFFPLLPYRWMLTPYSKTLYARDAAEVEATFEVHNNSPERQTFDLSVEFDDSPSKVELSDRQVTLDSGRSKTVTVRVDIEAGARPTECYLRATPARLPEFSTYSTLTIEPGDPPADRPLKMPITLEPYRHENAQFGYAPNYPTENQPFFDLDGRPSVMAGGSCRSLREGTWIAGEMTIEGRRFSPTSTRIAYDAAGDMYLLGRSGSDLALLRSTDDGRTFSAHLVAPGKGGGGSLDIEQFTGHNLPSGPPPVVRYTRTEKDPNLIWRSLYDLELFVPEKIDGRIEIGEPMMLSRKCIGLSAHSGIPSTIVSKDGKVHVAWGEATDPAVKVPGVPTYVATYDRKSKKLSESALVGYGPPANDVHNSPSITIDSRGYIHVIVGTHGRPFLYTRSKQPNDATRGWTEPVPVGENLRQTYIGLVCGADDTLHLVYRLWRYGESPHPSSYHATLAYQCKPVDGPWQPPRLLVVAAFSEYSIFYHRLNIDRRGRLFLSYDYWSTFWFYRNDHRGKRRALIMSPDGGENWKLVGPKDW